MNLKIPTTSGIKEVIESVFMSCDFKQNPHIVLCLISLLSSTKCQISQREVGGSSSHAAFGVFSASQNNEQDSDVMFS